LQFQCICNNSKCISYRELWVRGAQVEIILVRESAKLRDLVRGLYYQKLRETLVYVTVHKIAYSSYKLRPSGRTQLDLLKLRYLPTQLHNFATRETQHQLSRPSDPYNFKRNDIHIVLNRNLLHSNLCIHNVGYTSILKQARKV